jgi:hypothetical protein
MEKQWRMNPKERRELAISEIVLIVLAVIGLAVVVWVAWARPLQREPVVNSFADCQANSGVVQTSYPEVCVSPDGKRFVNPDQKVTLPSGAGTDEAGRTNNATRKNLTISKWKVVLPYPDNITSLSYHMVDGQTVHISLDDVPGDCKGTNMLRRATSTQDLDGNGHTPAQVQELSGAQTVKQIGDYYYMFTHSQDSCTTDEKVLQQLNALSVGFTGSKIQQLVLAK